MSGFVMAAAWPIFLLVIAWMAHRMQGRMRDYGFVAGAMVGRIATLGNRRVEFRASRVLVDGVEVGFWDASERMKEWGESDAVRRRQSISQIQQIQAETDEAFSRLVKTLDVQGADNIANQT